MNLPRRQFIRMAGVAAALSAVSRVANAQTYPARPVRLISPFPAGGPNDGVALLMGQWLSERLGQPFVIENRIGAGGNIGTEAAVKAPPDGYTLLVVGVVNTINATLYDKLNFNFTRDVAPVASIVRFPNVMVVNPSIPVSTVPDFVAYAKANPGKLNMASGGNGTASHVAGELFKMMTGVDLLHVPYRGAAPAVKQARVITRYVRGLIFGAPMLAAMVERETAEAIDLDNAVSIEVQTASYCTVRGYALAVVLADEIAFWPTDDAVFGYFNPPPK